MHFPLEAILPEVIRPHQEATRHRPEVHLEVFHHRRPDHLQAGHPARQEQEVMGGRAALTEEPSIPAYIAILTFG